MIKKSRIIPGNAMTIRPREDSPETGKPQSVQRRRARRVATYKRINVRECADGRLANPEPAVLCDISVFGVGLILDVAMKAGEQFVVHLEQADTELLYRVIRCKRTDEHCYQVGAEFVCVVHRKDSKCSDEEQERIRRFILS